MKCALFFLFALCSVQASNPDVPKLTLNASATIWKPADQLLLKIGVLTQGLTAEEALRENSRQMQQVICNLETIGLDRFDYETSHFSINPTYTPCPKDPPWNWRATINGYEVTNTILIHTQKLDIAGQIIDQANRAGANSITDIHFGLQNERDFITEALAAAGQNAVRDAQTIAESTNVRLIRVLSISLNHAQVNSPKLNMACMARADSGSSAPPVAPGEVSITANVSVVYEIN